jgi:hypothetical protein
MTDLIHVTSVLQFVGIRSSFEFLKPADREFYLGRGKMIHKATEFYDKGTLDESLLDERIIPYVEAYKLFRLEVRGIVKHSELAVSSDKYGYKGRIDRVIRASNLYDGEVIFDIKTTSSDTATRLQLSAYQIAYGFGSFAQPTRRGVVELKDNGKYECPRLYDRYEDQIDAAGWHNALSLCKWRMRYDKMPDRDDKKEESNEHAEG